MAKVGFKVLNTGGVVRSLQAQSLKGKKEVIGVVGFETPYAVYVHENLQAFHPVGQAKFLEVAYRQTRPKVRALIAERLRKKKALEGAVEDSLRVVLDRALELVPIDTGRLYQSGYIAI